MGYDMNVGSQVSLLIFYVNHERRYIVPEHSHISMGMIETDFSTTKSYKELQGP